MLELFRHIVAATFVGVRTVPVDLSAATAAPLYLCLPIAPVASPLGAHAGLIPAAVMIPQRFQSSTW